MEGKLIKVVDKGYYNLENKEGSLIATSYKFKNKDYNSLSKLSLKNCQAIENGYDLDDIIEQTKQTLDDSRISSYDSFKIGFQKAIEILGDKKFSEDCLKSMCSISFNFYKRNDLSDSELEEEWENWFKDTLQSLQQTEWDVVVERETVIRDFNGNVSVSADFKLDAENCLILKRK